MTFRRIIIVRHHDAVAFKKKIYRTIDELQQDLDVWVDQLDNLIQRKHCASRLLTIKSVETHHPSNNIAVLLLNVSLVILLVRSRTSEGCLRSTTFVPVVN